MATTQQFWITTAAIAMSPVIAVLVSMWVQSRREGRKQKIDLLYTLIATRNQIISPEHVQALNLIDLVFSRSAKVRARWRELFEMLSNNGLDNPNGHQQREKKRIELITEMAHELGYGRHITHLDADRIYIPSGMVTQNQIVNEIGAEFLRVLRQIPTQSPPSSAPSNSAPPEKS